MKRKVYKYCSNAALSPQVDHQQSLRHSLTDLLISVVHSFSSLVPSFSLNSIHSLDIYLSTHAKMPLLHQVLLATAVLGGLSNALPSKPSTKTSPPFRIDMVPKTHQTVRNGPASYLKALRKFGGGEDRISFASKAIGSAAASSVVATPADNDLEYTCPVKIGSQTFQLDFDTGSSDL